MNPILGNADIFLHCAENCVKLIYIANIGCDLSALIKPGGIFVIGFIKLPFIGQFGDIHPWAAAGRAIHGFVATATNGLEYAWLRLLIYPCIHWIAPVSN